MKRAIGLAGVLGWSLWLSGQTARADLIVTEAVSATITGGIDYDGIFGAPNANLTGDKVTLQLSYVLGSSIYDLSYSAVNGGYTNSRGALAMQETVTVGSTVFAVLGDNYQTEGITGVDQSGTPLGGGLTATAGAYCGGKFAALDSQKEAGECQDSVSVNFDFSAVGASILTQAGANALFLLTTGGTVTLNPYQVASAHPGDPHAESFTFTTDPEPATWLLAVAGMAGILLLRRRYLSG
jgi:MYXO-CTERM domain-containing protein